MTAITDGIKSLLFILPLFLRILIDFGCLLVVSVMGVNKHFINEENEAIAY